MIVENKIEWTKNMYISCFLYVHKVNVCMHTYPDDSLATKQNV